MRPGLYILIGALAYESARRTANWLHYQLTLR